MIFIRYLGRGYNDQTGCGVHLVSCRVGSGDTFSQGVKRPACETNHSPSPSSELENIWSFASNPVYVFMVWCLIKHKEIFIFLKTLPRVSLLHFTFYLTVCGDKLLWWSAQLTDLSMTIPMHTYVLLYLRCCRILYTPSSHSLPYIPFSPRQERHHNIKIIKDSTSIWSLSLQLQEDS